MSIYDAELRRRLARGDDPEATALWFMKAVVESNLDYAELTKFERAFDARITKAYRRWLPRREFN